MTDEDLVFKSAALARAAPAQWQEFLGSFKKFADARKDDCLKAPLGVLPVVQGRAQQTASLSDLFENAIKTADRIDSKKRGS